MEGKASDLNRALNKKKAAHIHTPRHKKMCCKIYGEFDNLNWFCSKQIHLRSAAHTQPEERAEAELPHPVHGLAASVPSPVQPVLDTGTSPHGPGRLGEHISEGG